MPRHLQQGRVIPHENAGQGQGQRLRQHRHGHAHHRKDAQAPAKQAAQFHPVIRPEVIADDRRTADGIADEYA